MLSGYRLESVGEASNYHAESMTQTADYYGGGENQLYWSTDGVEALGLVKGQGVRREDFEAVLSGQFTDKDGQIVDLTQNSKGHRPGFDMTWTPPKTVSIAALVADDKRVVELCSRINQNRIDFIEQNLAAHRRRAKGGEIEKSIHSGNMVTATVMHVSDREGMPNLHFHNVTANITRGADGNWRALDNDRFFGPAERQKMDAMANAELAAGLKAMGYKIELSKDGKSFEIAQFKSLKEATSVRSKMIDEQLKSWGIDPKVASTEQKQMANLATRKAKDMEHTDLAQLRPAWAALAKENGIDPGRLVPVAGGKTHFQPAPNDTRIALTKAIDSLSERGMAFSRLDLLGEASRFGLGKTSEGALEKMIGQWQREGQLVAKELVNGEKGWTTPGLIHSETKIKDFINSGEGTCDKTIFKTEAELQNALRDFGKRQGWQLSDEQASAARLVTNSTNRVGIIQGVAGTGKTASLKFAAEAAKTNGFITILGISPTGKAAKNLEAETGMQSDTLAGFLNYFRRERSALAAEAKAGRDVTTQQANLERFGTRDGSRLVVILDEGALASTRDVAQLASQLGRLEGVKLVGMGDTAQLTAVGGGKWFAQAQNEWGAKVSTIAKQRRFDNASSPVKSAIESVNQKRFVQSVETIVKNGAVVLDGNTPNDQLYKAAAATWIAERDKLQSDPAAKEKSVSYVVGTNVDRVGVANAIREERKVRGELGEGVTVQIHTQLKLTEAQQTHAANWVEGGATGAVSERDYKSIGVAKGELVKLVGVDVEKNVLHMASAKGHKFEVDLNQPQRTKFTPVVQEQRQYAKGDTIQARAAIGERGADRIPNGTVGVIQSITDKGAVVEWDMAGKKELKELSKTDLAKTDHGYGRTIVQEQGQSVGAEIVVMSKTGASNITHEGWNVAITRAKHETKLVTNALDQLKRSVGNSGLDRVNTAAEHGQEARGQAPKQREGQGPQQSKNARQMTKPTEIKSVAQRVAEIECKWRNEGRGQTGYIKSNIRTFGVGLMKDRYLMTSDGKVFRANAGVFNPGNSVALLAAEKARSMLGKALGEIKERDQAGVKVSVGQRVRETLKVTGLRIAANVASKGIKWQKVPVVASAVIKQLHDHKVEPMKGTATALAVGGYVKDAAIQKTVELCAKLTEKARELGQKSQQIEKAQPEKTRELERGQERQEPRKEQGQERAQDKRENGQEKSKDNREQEGRNQDRSHPNEPSIGL
jgi:conjugative relaxase-like TrwC/TraI family protein